MCICLSNACFVPESRLWSTDFAVALLPSVAALSALADDAELFLTILAWFYLSSNMKFRFLYLSLLRLSDGELERS